MSDLVFKKKKYILRMYKENMDKKTRCRSTESQYVFLLSDSLSTRTLSFSTQPLQKPSVAVLSLPVHEGFVAWLAGPDR